MNRIERLQHSNQKAYEDIQQSFDKTRQSPPREMAEYAAEVHSGFHVLDLGCGNGRLLKALPSVNFEYEGIDGNAYLLQKAREAFPNRTFTHAKLEDVVLAPSAYDVIFCSATLHHMVTRKDRLHLLQKCHGALTEGGVLIVSVWNLWQPQYIQYILAKPHLKLSWNDFFIPWKADTTMVWRYYHGFTKGELSRLFAHAGFRNYSITTLRGDTSRRYNYVVRAVKQ